MKTNTELFSNLFAKVEHTLDVDTVTDNENGTGYFDSMVCLPKPTDVSVSRFTDQHGRRGIVYYTKMGNVVVFERHVNDEAIVSNAPNWWSVIFPEHVVPRVVLDRMDLHANYPARIVLEFMEQKELWDENNSEG